MFTIGHGCYNDESSSHNSTEIFSIVNFIPMGITYVLHVSLTKMELCDN